MDELIGESCVNFQVISLPQNLSSVEELKGRTVKHCILGFCVCYFYCTINVLSGQFSSALERADYN